MSESVSVYALCDVCHKICFVLFITTRAANCSVTSFLHPILYNTHKLTTSKRLHCSRNTGSVKERDHLVDLDNWGDNIKIDLKGTACEGVGLESIDSGWSSVVGFCECGDEPQLFIH